MVRGFAPLIVVAVCLFGFDSVQAGNTYLNLTLDNPAIESGQFTLATLRYRGPGKLADINLDPWREQVAIVPFDELTEANANGQPIQVIKLRLYPRHQGVVKLPAIRLGRLSTAATRLTVKQPVIDQHPVQLDWSVSNNRPWQREAVIIRFSLTTNDYAAHIRVDPIEDKALQSRVLQTMTVRDGKRFIHSGGWLVQALNHGNDILQLPPVRYRLSGSDQRRFHLPLVDLDVQALPPYLPPTLPVGALKINSAIVNTGQTSNQNRDAWQVNISGPALLTRGLSGIDTTLAKFSRQPLSAIDFNASDASDINNPLNLASYHAPLPEWLWPLQTALQLELRYFDPASGQISRLQHHLPAPLRMPTWAWAITGLVGLLISAYGLYRLWPHWQSWQKRRRQVIQIKQQDSPAMIRKLLIAGDNFVSLGDWANQYPPRMAFAKKLNAACFGQRHIDVRELKLEAVQLLKK